MHDIHNYIPETNHVSRVCNVADVLWLQYTVHVMLPCWIFCAFTIVLPGICVHCPICMLSVLLLLLLLLLLYWHNFFSPFSSSSRTPTLTDQCDVKYSHVLGFWISMSIWYRVLERESARPRHLPITERRTALIEPAFGNIIPATEFQMAVHVLHCCRCVSRSPTRKKENAVAQS